MAKSQTKRAANEPSIRLCTELHAEGPAAIAAALEERPDNIAPMMAMRAAEDVPSPAVEMAVVITKLWRPGRTLKISFVGTIDPTVKKKIKDFAVKWLQFANLKFSFVGSGGDIRISTVTGAGSWSYIGTDAKTLPANQATMNYGWFTAQTPDAEFSRVILHEFGHAIGAIHEHQHPLGGIPWDKPAVYAYYARQGWNQAKVDQNIFAKYAADQLNLTAYDKTSIMHYAVPNALTIGDYEVGWNTALSSNDKTLAKRVYPK